MRLDSFTFKYGETGNEYVTVISKIVILLMKFKFAKS